MTDLCTNNTLIEKLNEKSLKNEKVTIINKDAYLFVQENKEK